MLSIEILIKYRLLQNRVSAQRFRQKRKNEFENLKDNLRRLIQENEMLRNQVSAFELLFMRQGVASHLRPRGRSNSYLTSYVVSHIVI